MTVLLTWGACTCHVPTLDTTSKYTADNVAAGRLHSYHINDGLDGILDKFILQLHVNGGDVGQSHDATPFFECCLFFTVPG